MDRIWIDNNNLYVYFSDLPTDYKSIMRSWALQGNFAIDFGVHVWAVPADCYKPVFPKWSVCNGMIRAAWATHTLAI